MQCSLGISDFLEEISGLSHSIVFLYLFALITEEGFLFSPCYSLNSAFKWVYLSFSPLLFASLLFTAIFKASLDSHYPLQCSCLENLRDRGASWAAIYGVAQSQT